MDRVIPKMIGKHERALTKSTLMSVNLVLMGLLVLSLLYVVSCRNPGGHTVSQQLPALRATADVPKCEETVRTEIVKEIVTIAQPPSSERKCVVNFRDKKMALCNFVNLAGGGNFGDELGPVVAQRLVENLFGCSAENILKLNLKSDESIRRENHHICLFSLGSVFHKIRNGDHIWGTGINPNWQERYPNNLTFYAVRGKLTEGLVRTKLHFDKALPLGDPGFAIPTLFPELQEMRKAAKIKSASPRFCFVPHAHDTSNANNQLDKSVRIITVFQRWRPVVETLAKKCDYLASTSLHGIIEADALGIPSLWFQWSESKVSKTEGHFKYLDYFSTVNKTITPTSDISQVLNISAYAKPLDESVSKELVKDMVASFPYHLFETTYETNESAE